MWQRLGEGGPTYQASDSLFSLARKSEALVPDRAPRFGGRFFLGGPPTPNDRRLQPLTRRHRALITVRDPAGQPCGNRFRPAVLSKRSRPSLSTIRKRTAHTPLNKTATEYCNPPSETIRVDTHNGQHAHFRALHTRFRQQVMPYGSAGRRSELSLTPTIFQQTAKNAALNIRHDIATMTNESSRPSQNKLSIDPQTPSRHLLGICGFQTRYRIPVPIVTSRCRHAASDDVMPA